MLKLRASDAPLSPSEIVVLNERLWSAAEMGDETLVRTLISVGAEVDSQPKAATPPEGGLEEDQSSLLDAELKGPSALHLAAQNGGSRAVCALVELGADVNIRDSEQCTPIHRAVAGNHLGWCPPFPDRSERSYQWLHHGLGFGNLHAIFSPHDW